MWNVFSKHSCKEDKVRDGGRRILDRCMDVRIC